MKDRLLPALAPTGVWTLRRDRRKHSVQVAGVFETDEMDVVRAAVAAGLGTGILPIYLVGDALQQGQLVTRLRQFQAVPGSVPLRRDCLLLAMPIYLVKVPGPTAAADTASRAERAWY
jgi:DNA-binding transcriptional LysR family regulator